MEFSSCSEENKSFRDPLFGAAEGDTYGYTPDADIG